MNIQVQELKQIFDKILEKLETEKITEVPLLQDYYWFISDENWSNFLTHQQNDLLVGSLLDDYEMLKKVIDNQNPCTFADFDRIAMLLRYISQFANPIPKTSLNL